MCDKCEELEASNASLRAVLLEASTWSHLTVCSCARSQVIPQGAPAAGSPPRALRSTPTPDINGASGPRRVVISDCGRHLCRSPRQRG
jgi:hypothetical protein